MHFRVWAVGLFLVIGFVLFTAILFLVGNRHRMFARHIEVYTEFSNLGGVEKGATVSVSGLDAGHVESIEIPHDASGKFRLKLQLVAKVRGIVRRDSVASIETQGVVGDKFVLISKGSDHSPEAGPGTTLRSKEPTDISAVLEKGSGLLNEVDETIKDLRGRMDVTLDTMTRTVGHADHMIVTLQPQFQKIASDGGQITSNLNLLVADLQNGKGPAGLLLKDEKTRQQLQDTLADVKQTTANFQQASVQVNGILTDFQSRELAGKAEASLQNVEQISEQLNATLKEALADDEQGENGASNIRRTLSNLRRGTANLAEDTEALKRSFFFRGYFKRRGYYNLDQLTPKDYLSAKGLQTKAGTRLWLRASIFETSSDGTEQLSPAGQKQIDQAVGPVVDALPECPIVVEGYSAEGAPSQQFVTSRERAEVVRRYLETRFQLNHSHLGIVALRGKPPESSGVSDWDGAAIVVFNGGQKN